ncbi:MAG: AsmA family protein [Bacteroidetes bacterium]|nr:AsmA family protein [Bacteroidota bacterium]MBU1422062.1 AsmA family protein [Bacteroidota bacterium]MBU2636393.1 AsmA family protein [Bacteroidota bacterium]
MTGKKKKFWLVLISIPVIIIVGVTIFLKLYFTNERLKSFVIPQIEEATQRQVEIKDISLSIFPTFGIEIEGFRISNPPNVKFESKDFISLDELLIDVEIFALLRNRVEVNEFKLTKPVIFLEVNKDGIANYSMPADAHKPEREPEVTVRVDFESSAALLVSNFRITDGNIQYVDFKEDRRFVIEGFNQKTRIATASGANNIIIKSDVGIDGISYGSTKSLLVEKLPVKMNLTLSYVGEKDELVFDSVLVKIRELGMKMTGAIANTQTTPYVNLKIESNNEQVSKLLTLLPQELLKASEGLTTTGLFNLSLAVKGELSDSTVPAVTGNFSALNGALKYAQLPKSITNINLRGEFERTSQIGRFEINKLSLNLGNNSVTGKFSVNDFDDPSLSANFNAAFNLTDIKDYYPLDKGTELSGVMKGNVSLAGKVKAPKNIKADGKLEFDNVSMMTADSPKPVKNFTGTIAFNNQIIESKQLSMNIGESDLKLAFKMSNYLAMFLEEVEGKPSVSLTLNSNNLRTADLILEPRLPRERGLRGEPSTETKTGEKPKQVGLPFPDVDISASVNIQKLSTDKFDFSNARGSMNIKDGIVMLQNFSVNAFQGNITTQGTLDLRKFEERPFNLELDITGVEANAFLPKFTSFGNNLFGKFSMNTKMKGSLDDTLGLISQTLSGDGRVQVNDGRFVGYPLMASIAEFTGVQELRSVDFKNWSNIFTISNGRITLKDLKINALNNDFSVNGSQGFDGSLDYRIGIKLSGSLSDKIKLGGTAGQVINLLKDKDGRVTINLSVGGYLTKPAISINTKEQQKQLEELARQEFEKKKSELEGKILEEGKQLVDSVKQKGAEGLKKKAEDAFKKLFKKP